VTTEFVHPRGGSKLIRLGSRRRTGSAAALELVEELRLRLIGFDQLKQLAELSCRSRRFE
jgi:hypothetical protein